MTEAQWLAATSSEGMARFLCDELKWFRKPKGRRKLRLFACACCRRAWHLLDNERSRHAVEVAERYAEGTLSKAELDRVWNGGETSVCCESVCALTSWAAVQAPFEAWSRLAWAGEAERKGGYETIRAAENLVQAALAWDIFGNPFRPVTADPAWLTDTVMALANQVYESRDFSAMPILADALQDAGCDSDDILTHCRGEGPHVRGCWVVDLVLGKV